MKKFNQSQIKKYWERRASWYDALTVDNMQSAIDLCIDCIKANQPNKILDIGSGLGRVYKYVRSNGYNGKYTMCDFSEKMRIRCQENTGVLPDYWDGETLPYNDNVFDFVILSNVLLHVSPKKINKVVSEVARVVAGTVFVIDTNVSHSAIHCFNHNYANVFTVNELILANFVVYGKICSWELIMK